MWIGWGNSLCRAPEWETTALYAVPGLCTAQRRILAAMVAYLKSVPPVDNARTVGIAAAGQVLLLAGEYLAGGTDRVVPTSANRTRCRANGRIWDLLVPQLAIAVNATGQTCRSSPATRTRWHAPLNLTPGGQLQFWSEAEFIHAMRTGERPNGTTLSSDMPWRTRPPDR